LPISLVDAVRWWVGRLAGRGGGTLNPKPQTLAFAVAVVVVVCEN
jgi:hypothetical protein